MWNFDGVACAAALELGNPVFLFHSNHLLYGFLGSLFWKYLLYPFGISRALPGLQLFTSFLSALGLLGLYQALSKQLKESLLPLFIVLCMGVTAVFWVWSIEAQVYALGFLGLSWATYFLLEPWRPGKWVWVGLSHAFAVLGHVVHVVWLIPALYWLYKEKGDALPTRKRNLLLYGVAFGLGVSLPYGLVLCRVIMPGHKVAWVVQWLLGSTALTPERHFAWHSVGWKGPFLWAYTTLRFFWGSLWPYSRMTRPGLGMWTLTALSGMGFLALGARSFKKRHQPLWVFCILWLLVYGIFFWTWEPETECYRMSDAAPIALLMMLALQTWEKKVFKWAIIMLLFLTTFPLNLMTRIIPMSHASENVSFQQTLDLSRKTPQDSLYLTGGGAAWIYLLYFTGRLAWNLHSFRHDLPRLESEITRHHKLGPVFIQSSILGDGLVRFWLARYKLQPLDKNLPWVQLL